MNWSRTHVLIESHDYAVREYLSWVPEGFYRLLVVDKDSFGHTKTIIHLEKATASAWTTLLKTTAPDQALARQIIHDILEAPDPETGAALYLL